MSSNKAFVLQVEHDPVTGQLLRLSDPDTGVELAAYVAGAELAWNGVPLRTELVSVDEARSEHITLMRAEIAVAYGAAATLEIRRVLVLGGCGLHAGRTRNLEWYYEVRRLPHLALGDSVDAIWQPLIEGPLHLETLTVLAAPVRRDPATRMRALAMGGSGPREHVGIEDGPVAEVVPWLQCGFRNVFPGQQTVNGALYYRKDDGEPFVWVVARRPSTGGEIEFGEDRHAYRFYAFKPFPVNDEFITPAITFAWGRGLEESDRVLAGMFDHYEEPQDWFFHTCWFWLHTAWTRNGTFDGMRKAAEILMDEGGINGFGLLMHDVPAAGRDIDVGSFRSSPLLGGAEKLRQAMAAIRERGGHSYAWTSRHGHRSNDPRWQESWAIRGVDGRPVRLRAAAEHGVSIDIMNPRDPSFIAYMKDWIQHYVQDLGIDGLFWDSGFQPIYPDFGNKAYQRYPGETLAAAQYFYDEIYRFGRSLHKDFFMWAEGISPDYAMNMLSVDGQDEPGDRSKQALMQRLAHAGPQRLVWRSHRRHDLASGFVMTNPVSDIGWNGGDLEPYRRMANDPGNRAVVSLVKEKGVREAIGLGDGRSLLENFVVISPDVKGEVIVPGERCVGSKLRNVVSGAEVAGKQAGASVVYDVPAAGVYEMV